MKKIERELMVESIYRVFGQDNQIDKLAEELFELQHEIACYKANIEQNEDSTITKEMISEMIDVKILIDQLLIDNEKEGEKEYDRKVLRTIDRIKEGYYEQT